MLVALLTKAGGPLSPIASILGYIMNGIYMFFHLFGIQNIALSIIIFTFFVRTLMLPLTIKQQKFSKLSARMNPELQAIQAKYKGKKDEASLRKQQEESQALYQKYGTNPASGCLPLLITLPIMFALYSVINNIPAYVGSVKSLYETVAISITGIDKYADILKGLSEGITRISPKNDFSSVNLVIDALVHFDTNHWNQLATSFPTISNVIGGAAGNIAKVNSFLGFNIADPPGWGFPGIIIPIVAMVLQFIQGKQIEVKTKTNNGDPSANMMKSMNIVMPIMSGFFCVTFPIGIGIYWIATSVYMIIQQFFVNKYMDRIDVEKLIEKNVVKASKRRKTLTQTAASGTSLQELAKRQTRSIESSVSDKAKTTVTSESSKTQEVTGSEPNEATTSGGAKSISEIANLLKNRSIDKGDK